MTPNAQLNLNKLLQPDAFPRRNICQKFVCGRGSAPHPAGGASSGPKNLRLDLRGLLLRAVEEVEGKGKAGEERRGEKGKESGKGRERVIQVLHFPHFKPLLDIFPHSFAVDGEVVNLLWTCW